MIKWSISLHLKCTRKFKRHILWNLCLQSLCTKCVLDDLFVGIVLFKMKILSSFSHTQVVPNLYEFLSSAEHKGRYFVEKEILWKSMDAINSLVKGIVHFEINFSYVLSYLKGIQDVGVFVSAVFSFLIFCLSVI